MTAATPIEWLLLVHEDVDAVVPADKLEPIAVLIKPVKAAGKQIAPVSKRKAA